MEIDDALTQKQRPASLNVTRLTNGASPKVSNEVKLRTSNLNNRNSQLRSSTLQEDLIRLISPEYISESSGSDNGIDTGEDSSPDIGAPSFLSSGASTPQKSIRPVSMGVEAPSSELYSMRLSAIGTTSPKYISPQRQSWSTSEGGGDDRKLYQQISSPASSMISQGDSAEIQSNSNGLRSKSPLKNSFSANLFSDQRTPIGGGSTSTASTSSQGSFRVTPSVSVGQWVKDEHKPAS